MVFEPGTVLDRRAPRRAREPRRRRRSRSYPRPRVGVLSTGDELVESGPLAPGQIRDSNRPMLLALLAEAGCEPVDLGIAHDDEARHRPRRSTTRSTRCDALHHERRRVGGRLRLREGRARAHRGRRPERHRRRLVAGRDQARRSRSRSRCVRGAPVFGLPGNPVSSHVSFELFARPALRQMMGHAQTSRPLVRRHRRRRDAADASTASSTSTGSSSTCDDGRYVASAVGAQASNALAAMAAANGARPAARRRRRRRRRRRHRHAARLTLGPPARR